MPRSAFIFALLFASSLFGQADLKFEVATVKPTSANFNGTRVTPKGLRVFFQNMTLRDMVYWAYGSGLSTAVRVTGGPDWANQTRYDVEGLAPASIANPTQRQFRTMLRALLGERFALKAHNETQSIDVYALELARPDGKLGPKVKAWDGTCGGQPPASDDDPATPRCASGIRAPGIRLEGAPMFSAAEVLSLPQPRGETGRIVLDQTGLKGRYTMELEFQFSDRRAQPGVAPELPDGPSLFTALKEQWGLKLEPTKGPLQVIAIDSAQRPTEN